MTRSSRTRTPTWLGEDSFRRSSKRDCTRIGAFLDKCLIPGRLTGVVAVEKLHANHFVISDLHPEVKPIYLARQRRPNLSQPLACFRRLPVVPRTGIRCAGHFLKRA